MCSPATGPAIESNGRSGEVVKGVAMGGAAELAPAQGVITATLGCSMHIVVMG